jgi:hypothetical protein
MTLAYKTKRGYGGAVTPMNLPAPRAGAPRAIVSRPRSRALLLLLLCTSIAVTWIATGAAANRVLAIGDIHGSFDNFVTILTRTGLIDSNRRWSGSTARLVQTGDFTDRGEGVRAVMDLLMGLEPQARKSGGELIVLLGNHEVMNLVGDTRDVTPEIFATFADATSASRRENAWRQYEELARNRRAQGADVTGVYSQSREAWTAARPPGYFEYRDALGPRGTYGRWLRTKSPVVRVDGTAFMHAGVDPSTNELALEEVNAAVKNELARFDAYVRTLVDRKLALPFFSLEDIIKVTVGELKIATEFVAARKEDREAPAPTLDGRWLQEAAAIYDLGKWAILDPEGPMWFRGYATWPETSAPMVTTILQRFRVERIVVAHTPQLNGSILPRFGNRVFLIDTGMLTSVYKGRPSALEIEGGRIRALYPNESVVLVN